MSQRSIVKGSGNVISETRELSDFDKLRLSGVGRVEVVRGAQESITIEAEDNILPMLDTAIEEGALDIRTLEGYDIRPTRPIRYTVTVQGLTALELRGAGDMVGTAFTNQALSVGLTGSGSIQLSDCPVGYVHFPGAGRVSLDGVQVPAFNAALSGAGQLTVSGSATSQQVMLPGAGQYDARNLISADVMVNLSGMGRAIIQASQSLTVSLSGLGSIEYFGDPVVNKRVSGLGRITSRGALVMNI